MNFYYGLVDIENNGYGFVLEDDPRRTPDFIELTEEEHQQLLDEQSEGCEIVFYEGKVFATPDIGLYYINENGIWCKKEDNEYEASKAEEFTKDLVNAIYQIKADKAYNGVIINGKLIFETNQTSITNTVASLALMNDTAKANWKFYTVNGEPVVQQVTKAQLAGIAQFGQNMINECFAVEGKANEELKNATQEDVLNETWRSTFIDSVTSAMNEVSNTLTVDFS